MNLRRIEFEKEAADSAEETLRLIARLPAPEGLVGSRADEVAPAPRAQPGILAWPLAFAPGGWGYGHAVRGAAAAAIVCVVAGGGWRDLLARAARTQRADHGDADARGTAKGLLHWRIGAYARPGAWSRADARGDCGASGGCRQRPLRVPLKAPDQPKPAKGSATSSTEPLRSVRSVNPTSP